MKSKVNTGKNIFPFRKIISIILAIIMTFSALPVLASAIGAEEQNIESGIATPIQQEEEPEKVNEEDDFDPFGMDEYEGMTEEEILEVLQTKHYTFKSEGEEITFGFDSDGSIVVEDLTQAQGFFNVLGSGEDLAVKSSPAGGYKFDDRYKTDGYLFTLIDFVLNHNSNECIFDKYSRTYIYGVKDIAYRDDDLDFKCDICGRCIAGCVDGELYTYSDDEHKKTVEVEEVDEQGNLVYDESGNPKMTTYEYYETVYINTDGKCDVCKKDMCSSNTGHVYSDGKCDTCGFCVNGHVDYDKKDGGENVCDTCGACLSGHTDADNDGVCDKCKMTFACTLHTDENNDGKCDKCGMCYLSDHYDGNSDGLCDRCGKCCGEHIDVAENDGAGDGFCDTCKVCVKGHSDSDSDGFCDVCKFTTGFCMQPDKDSNGICDFCNCCISGVHTDADFDWVCDECGKSTALCADHSETVQTKCIECGTDYCPVVSSAELVSANAWLSAVAEYISANSDLISGDTGKSITVLALSTKNEVISLIKKTYDRLNSMKTVFDATDDTIKSNIERLKDFMDVSGDKIYADGNAKLFSTMILTLASSLASIKAMCDEETTDKNKESTFTPQAKKYCDAFYKEKYKEVYDSVLSKLSNTCVELLNAELDDIFGKDYESGFDFVTKDNRLALQRKADSFDYELYNFLYGDDNENAYVKTSDYFREIAPNVATELWERKFTAGLGYNSFALCSGAERNVIGYYLLPKLLKRTKELLPICFKDYENDRKARNDINPDGKDYLAIREKMDNDLAREEVEDDYYITDESVTQLVRKIDNFITSDQFLKLLGIEDESLSSYVTKVIENIFSDKDMFNGLFNGVLEKLFPLICGFVDGDLEELLWNFIDDEFISTTHPSDGNYGIWLMELVQWLLTELANWPEAGADILTGVLISFTGFAYVHLNGALGTSTFRELIQQVKISIYPFEIAKCIDNYDYLGEFDDIVTALNNSENSWDKVDFEKLDWKVTDIKSFEYAIGALLSPFSDVPELVFSSSKKLNLNLTDVARATFNVLLLHIWPLAGSYSFNIVAESSPLNIYGQIIVPLFEALGVNNNTPNPSLNHKMHNIGTSEYAYDSVPDSLDCILEAVFALVEQIAANPLEKILSILPNLFFYLQNGFIPELMNIVFEMEHLYLRVSSESAAAYIAEVLAKLTVTVIIPATALLFIPFVGPVLYGVATLPALTLNGVLGLFVTFYMVPTGFDLKGVANKLFNVGDILSGIVSTESLGFDVNNITNMLAYFLGDSPLMNIINVIDFDKIGYLGELNIHDNSGRDKRTSEKYKIGGESLLSEGEYYFVDANIGEVLWFILDAVTDILGDEEAFGTILDMTGMKLEDLQAIVDGLNLDEYGINISVGDTISGIQPEDLLFVLSELIVPSDKYDLKELEWSEADEETKADVDGHDGEIPYLEYDNIWDKDLANALTSDISASVDSILETVNGMVDLKGTLGIEDVSSVGSIVGGLLDKYVDPSMVTTVAELLANLGDTLGENAETVELLTRLDLKQWKNDFGYLFTDTSEPGSRFLPLLTGEKNGDSIKWTYNGKDVKTSDDIINAVCYLLKPLEKVLDYVLCGKDLGIVAYDKAGGISGEVITLKGSESYNYVIIPFLEALGIASEKIPSQKEFNDMGSSAGLAVMLNLIIGRVLEIANNPDIITETLKIFTQFLYMFSSGGLDVLVSDLLHPVFVLIDIIRPVFDLDVDGIISTLICKYTYTIGGYKSEEEMLKVMEDRSSKFRIEDLTPQTLLKAVSVIASVKDGDNRLFLDVNRVLNTAFNDLAYLRQDYVSKSVDSEGEPVVGYKISTDGAGCLTVLISFIMEILMEGDTAKIIDGIIGKPGLADTVVDFLWGIELKYSNAFNWAYILGEDATAEQKEALLNEIKEKGSISVDGRRTEQAQKDFDKYLETYKDTRWDKETAEYLEKYLTDMLETVLNDVLDEKTGDRLADTLFEEADFRKDRDVTLADVLNFLVDGYIADETVDKIVYLVSGLLTGDTLKDYKDIIYCVDGILDIDLSLYEAVDRKLSGDRVIYLDKDGKETGLTRRAVNVKDDFAGALADILKPFSKAVSWLFLGDDLEFFNTTGALKDRAIAGVNKSKQRRDDLICVTGSEGYKYGLIPLLEAIGCENLEEADSYENDGVYNTDKFLEDLIGSMMSWVLNLIGDGNGPSVIDNLVTILPNLFYYINSNGLTVSVNNIIATVSSVLDIYSEKSGQDVSLASLLGFPLDNLTFEGIFDIIESFEFDKADGSGEKCKLSFNSFIRELLSSFTIGEIYYNADSKFVYDIYGMRFADDSDRAKMLVILVSFIFDFLEDPDNKDAFASLLSPEIADTITNIFNMKKFRFDMQDFTWRFTEYEDSDVLINALDMSDLFKGDEVYGELWTRKMAAELADNLEQFISDMLYLIGLEIDGVPVRDFRSLVHILLGSLVFNGDTVNSVTAALGQIKPLLDTYDKDGYIAGFIKELLDIDLHSWDEYAPGGKYEKGRDWGFVTENMSEQAIDENMTVFENALIELLSPLAPFITWLMCEEDFTLFVEGDGLGNAEQVQLTICGAEAYAYSYIPLLEALNVDGSPKDITENLRRNNILSPADYTERAKEDDGYALYGIVHPLMAKIGNIMDSTVPEILELLPSIVYFINCNGLDTCIKNLIHAVFILLNAIEPIGRQIETFVYDEQGINIYKTIDFEGIIKNSVYGILGITEEDMVELYRSMGDEYKTVDGLEDVDFKFLFAVAVAKLNGLMKDAGLGFKFTTIAGDAVKELTCGYVRGFTSLNGRQAYTMIMDKEIDSQCYGDLITIILRLVLKFLSTDNNADALMHLIQSKAKMSPAGYEITDSLMKLIVRYMASPNNAQIAMTAVYYTVYGVSQGSGAGVTVYDDVNAKWVQVINKLENLNNPIAAEIMKTLISVSDEYADGVIDSNGIASKGFYSFFEKIIEWFKMIINFIKGLFD